jgi:hypothetical protein
MGFQIASMGEDEPTAVRFVPQVRAAIGACDAAGSADTMVTDVGLLVFAETVRRYASSVATAANNDSAGATHRHSFLIVHGLARKLI